MKIVFLAILYASTSLSFGRMTPEQIALALLSCPPYPRIEPGQEDKKHLLEQVLIKIADNNPKDVRDGLAILQQTLDSPALFGSQIAVNCLLTTPLLFEVMFERPRGRLGDMPPSRLSFQSYEDNSMTKDTVIEYSLPIQVDKEGKITIRLYYGAYNGHVSSNLVDGFDYCIKNYPLRKIDYSVQNR